MVNVDYTGKVIWLPLLKYTSACKLDMLEYPFDIQTCHMTFGSWGYDNTKIDMAFINNKQEVIMDSYMENTEWEIINNTANRNIQKYECCPNKFVDITYTLILKRRITFHLRLILIPTAILSSLTLVIFWIPPNRPDRSVMGE